MADGEITNIAKRDGIQLLSMADFAAFAKRTNLQPGSVTYIDEQGQIVPRGEPLTIEAIDGVIAVGDAVTYHYGDAPGIAHPTDFFTLPSQERLATAFRGKLWDEWRID